MAGSTRFSSPGISSTRAEPDRVGAFERLPKWLNLVPMVAQWLWLGIRHGSVTLPSSANPHITAGGLVGDTKSEYFNGMGPLARWSPSRILVGAASGCAALTMKPHSGVTCRYTRAMPD